MELPKNVKFAYKVKVLQNGLLLDDDYYDDEYDTEEEAVIAISNESNYYGEFVIVKVVKRFSVLED